MSRAQVVAQINECEKRGEFDKHIDPVDYSMVIPVDENYHFIKKGFIEKTKYFFENTFIVRPYTFYLNKIKFKTRINGKVNIRGIKAAVVTCNHVNKFDCLVVKGAIGQKLYVTAAPFNNMKGFLGEMMRAGKMIPLSESFSGMKKFNQAIDTLLNKNKFVLFYPEQAMWWYYKKPRPNKNGAFHYAVKNNVPVIPSFITFVETGKTGEEGFSQKQFILNFGKPIYIKPELTARENIEYLKNANFQAWKEIYETFYSKKLEYAFEKLKKKTTI